MKRSAIKTDLFASSHHREKIEQLGDPLHDIETHIDFSALAAEVDVVAPHPLAPPAHREAGHPILQRPWYVFWCSSASTVAIGVPGNRHSYRDRLYNLSDEQMEYQLLDRMSYQRFS